VLAWGLFVCIYSCQANTSMIKDVNVMDEDSTSPNVALSIGNDIKIMWDGLSIALPRTPTVFILSACDGIVMMTTSSAVEWQNCGGAVAVVSALSKTSSDNVVWTGDTALTLMANKNIKSIFVVIYEKETSAQLISQFAELGVSALCVVDNSNFPIYHHTHSSGMQVLISTNNANDLVLESFAAKTTHSTTTTPPSYTQNFSVKMSEEQKADNQKMGSHFQAMGVIVVVLGVLVCLICCWVNSPSSLASHDTARSPV